MKNLIIIMLLIMPSVAQSQTKEDYSRIMGRLVKYINSGQLDSLNSIIATYKWDEEELNLVKKTYGDIKFFEYMVVDSNDKDQHSRPSAYFAAVSTKEWHGKNVNALCFSLSEDNKLTSWRIMTKSRHSDSMLNRYYYKISN